MRRLILVIISAFVLISSPAFAKDAGTAVWIVSQLSGDARVVHPGLQPAALRSQARLQPGDRIITGLTGRATLTHGADYIIVAPRSDLQLPATQEPQGFTRVIQNLGTMLFKVKHTGVPHFTVDTPMLAAVVKGTTFTIVVDKDRSAVQVIQGKVQVTATEGGMSKLVEGGKTVFIDRGAPKLLIDADQRSPATTTSSAGGGVRLNGSQTPSVAAIANLTEGLVHPDTPAAAPTGATATATPVLPAAQPVVNVVETAVPGATDAIGDVVDTAADVAGSAAPGLTDTVTDVVGTVTDVVDTTVPGVTDTVTDVVGTVADVVDTTVPGVTDTVIDVVDTTTDTVTGVVDTVTDIAGGILDLDGDNSGPGSTGSGSGSGGSGSGGSGSSGSGSGNSGTDSGLIGGILGGLFPH